jgi:Reverse transcriptase (RNA-dependent DNA polymerase)
VGRGIRQGDSLSPLLFNLIMDEIILQVKNLNRGYRMGEEIISIVCYADDAILIAESEDDLQRLLYQFNITARKFNMIISPNKTKVW